MLWKDWHCNTSRNNISSFITGGAIIIESNSFWKENKLLSVTLIDRNCLLLGYLEILVHNCNRAASDDAETFASLEK